MVQCGVGGSDQVVLDVLDLAGVVAQDVDNVLVAIMLRHLGGRQAFAVADVARSHRGW